MHRLDLGIYSHPKEFWGNAVRTHVNSQGKNPLYWGKKISPEEDRTHDAASSKTVSPSHYQRAIPAPWRIPSPPGRGTSSVLAETCPSQAITGNASLSAVVVEPVWFLQKRVQVKLLQAMPACQQLSWNQFGSCRNVSKSSYYKQLQPVSSCWLLASLISHHSWEISAMIETLLYVLDSCERHSNLIDRYHGETLRR